MLDPKTQSDWDQQAATLAEMFPPLWRRLYNGLVCEGFTKEEAMALLKTYILCSGTIKP